MHDLIVRHGQVLDGTGADAVAADVAIDNGRITEIGAVDGPARRVVDADGQVVAPGFVDVHTHFDVQGFWDPTLSPSPLHGVTTALAGNCGFTVAPLDDEAGEYLMRMLARVEGMPLTALERGVPWDWRSTAEFLDRLDGTLAINTGYMVGHSAVRRVVMGTEATERRATPGEIETMAAMVRQGLAAGALGFSSTWAETHNDGDGKPVPSRHASAEEIVALAEVCREHAGTSLEFLPVGTGPFNDEVTELMIAMSVAARRPLNWNIISVSAASLPYWYEKLAVSDAARQRGGKVVGLVIPSSPAARFSFRTGFVLDTLPGWSEAMTLPFEDKMRLLRDPAGRADLATKAAQPSPSQHLSRWDEKVIVECFTDATKRYEGRRVGDIAGEEGKDPFDVLCDISLADGLRTSFINGRRPDSAEDWEARARIWSDPRAVVGASDAGAHLDMMATFNYTTVLLEQGVRRHGLLRLAEAVHLLTDVPARLYGLVDRGRLAPGAWADLVVFDPDALETEDVHTVEDLPGGAGRLFGGARGISGVFVAGQQIVADGAFTDARPGRVLRSGRDTATPALS